MDRAEIETGFGPDTFMLLADLSKSLFLLDGLTDTEMHLET